MVEIPTAKKVPFHFVNFNLWYFKYHKSVPVRHSSHQKCGGPYRLLNPEIATPSETTYCVYFYPNYIFCLAATMTVTAKCPECLGNIIILISINL